MQPTKIIQITSVVEPCWDHEIERYVYYTYLFALDSNGQIWRLNEPQTKMAEAVHTHWEAIPTPFASLK